MHSTGRWGSRRITATMVAAAGLRRAARFTDPARRADAVWAALARLPPVRAPPSRSPPGSKTTAMATRTSPAPGS